MGEFEAPRLEIRRDDGLFFVPAAARGNVDRPGTDLGNRDDVGT